jgi:LysR family transcriptional regulator for metE and metH
VQLFHRSGKGLVLTEKGEFLYRKALPLLAQMNGIRAALTGERPADRGELRVAAGFSFVRHLIPDIVREFNECFPRWSLSVRAAERETALDLVRDRFVDLAVLVDPPADGPEFTYERLFEDELRVLVHARNPLASLEVVPLRSLSGKTLVVSRSQSHTLRQLQQEMRRRGLEFKECLEVGGTAAVCEMVKLGQGLALLPDWVVQAESASASLACRAIAEIRPRRVWAVVTATGSPASHSARTFVRLCHMATRSLERTAAVGAATASVG